MSVGSFRSIGNVGTTSCTSMVKCYSFYFTASESTSTIVSK